MKILLSAFACMPGRGSEPEVGWGVVRQVNRAHDVWVMVPPWDREAIEQALSDCPMENAHFISVDLPWFWRRWGSHPGDLHHLLYLLWQVSAFQTARRLCRQQDFDVVHHVTYVNSWLPSFMGWLGIPFLWSAGTRDKTPLAFFSELSWSSRLSEFIRNLALTFLGWVTQLTTARHASLILSASRPEAWPHGLPVQHFALGGLGDEDMDRLLSLPERQVEPFRILSIGRFLGLKGFGMGLKAFARLRQRYPHAEYWLIGEGPEESHLRMLACELGCEQAVRFFGWMPRDQLFEYLSQADLVLHPSLHEQFGFVILEAMAAGKPVICGDVGGPSLLVRDGCGFKITFRNPHQAIADIELALARLASDPILRRGMGENARQCARSWRWETVLQNIGRYYAQISDAA